MILHFIFVVREEDRAERRPDYTYVQKMADFFGTWIRQKFGVSYEVQCDELVVEPRRIFQRLDTHTLVRDHEQRGRHIYHFYLTYFRPMWTDCTCEGYHAENFGMVFWQRPRPCHDGEEDPTLFFAEKNCTAVSHELLHELLRASGYKRFTQDVHDLWTRHLFGGLEFEQYGPDHCITDDKPVFLTVDPSQITCGSGV